MPQSAFPSASAPGARRGRLLGNLALLLGGILAVLALAEGVLRLFGLASPVLYRADPEFGYEPRPGQVSSRLGTRVHINDAGLRDDEDLASLMRGTERVLVIGNSVTYGSSLVSQEELFTEVAERRLRSTRPGLKVLNGGVAGYSVSQMVKRAPRLIERTDPHHLVLYVIGEDFRRAPVRYPPDDSPQEPLRRPRSALVIFVHLSLAFIDGRHRLRERLPILKPFFPRGSPSVIPPYDRGRVADIHFAALEEFLTAWEASGRRRSELVAFISPDRAAVAENDATRNAGLVRRFEELRVRVHDLQPDFRRAVEAGARLEDLYHDEIHYRPAGNELAGRLLAARLSPLLAARTAP